MSYLRSEFSTDEKDERVRPEDDYSHHDHDHAHCHEHDHEHDRDLAHDDRDGDYEFGTDAVYCAHGIQFRHPGDWTVTEDVGPDETTISVQSEGTSYWSLTLIDDAPDPIDVIEIVLGAYRDEYTDVDVYEVIPAIESSAVARDIDFVCLDLVNSASLMAFRTNRRTVLVVGQGTDHELKTTRAVLDSMTQSLSCEEGLPLDD
jgi:hypothetical protein